MEDNTTTPEDSPRLDPSSLNQSMIAYLLRNGSLIDVSKCSKLNENQDWILEEMRFWFEGKFLTEKVF